MTTVSAVVCTHDSDRLEDLVRGLDALARQSLTAAEVIVVVDRNPALAAAVAQERPDVRVVEETAVGGVSAARNTGIAAATGEVVAFLDDDAVPEVDWLARLVAPYADPDVVIVGGWAEPAWDSGRPAHLPHELDWLVGCSHRGTPTDASRVRNVVGASLSLRRTLVDQIGGFDDRVSRRGGLPLGCDDTEFCIRAAQRRPGSKVVIEPAAVVRHRVPAGRGTWSYLRRRSYAEGLSKAAVAGLAGARAATSQERDYALRVLPRAVVRDVLHLRWRSVAGMVTALVWTTSGYVIGRARWRGRRRARIDER